MVKKLGKLQHGSLCRVPDKNKEFTEKNMEYVQKVVEVYHVSIIFHDQMLFVAKE